MLREQAIKRLSADFFDTGKMYFLKKLKKAVVPFIELLPFPFFNCFQIKSLFCNGESIISTIISLQALFDTKQAV